MSRFRRRTVAADITPEPLSFIVTDTLRPQLLFASAADFHFSPAIIFMSLPPFSLSCLYFHRLLPSFSPLFMLIICSFSFIFIFAIFILPHISLCCRRSWCHFSPCRHWCRRFIFLSRRHIFTPLFSLRFFDAISRHFAFMSGHCLPCLHFDYCFSTFTLISAIAFFQCDWCPLIADFTLFHIFISRFITISVARLSIFAITPFRHLLLFAFAIFIATVSSIFIVMLHSLWAPFHLFFRHYYFHFGFSADYFSPNDDFTTPFCRSPPRRFRCHWCHAAAIADFTLFAFHARHCQHTTFISDAAYAPFWRRHFRFHAAICFFAFAATPLPLPPFSLLRWLFSLFH